MRVTLEAELSIAGAGRLKSALVTALAGAEPVVLDASAVAAVDLAALQVLAAAAKSAARAGKTLTFAPDGRSALLDHAATLGGFTHAGGDASGLFPVQSHG